MSEETRSNSQLKEEYDREGVIRICEFLKESEVTEIREELDRYIREDLKSKPADAATYEADGESVRNLWRLETHNEKLRAFGERKDILDLVGVLVNGDPILCAIETFNKPAKIGSGVPPHQDNAYFCQVPGDMLTVWVAIDAVTQENGPVTYLEKSHKRGMLPTRPSGVRGNSIGLADPEDAKVGETFVGLLNPGDATIHHSMTVHYSAPNRTENSRLGFLLVYKGSHTQNDPDLRKAYTSAAS